MTCERSPLTDTAQKSLLPSVVIPKMLFNFPRARGLKSHVKIFHHEIDG